MIEPWMLYPELRDQVITLVSSLDSEELGRTVPLTAEWTVAQVVAHLCGLNADIVAGAREGLGTDERTAAQVANRAEMTTAQVCDEWLEHDEAMQAIAAEVPLLEERLAADLVIHLHDMQDALGHPIDQEDDATISAARLYATRSPERWAEAAGVQVRVELTDGFVAGPDNPDVWLRASPYDFLRSVSGRRSRQQVEALQWSEVPGAVIETFSPYAPLGTVDAAI